MVSKKDRGEQAKQHIKETFWALLKEKPTGRITVMELCQKAGYSRYTFYRYFLDIYDVLNQIEEDILQETDRAYLSILPNREPGRLIPTIDELDRVQVETQALLQSCLPVLFGKNGDPQFHDKMRAHYIMYMKAYFPDAFSRGDLEDAVMAEFFTSGFIAALSFLGQNADKYTFREMMETIYRRLGITP